MGAIDNPAVVGGISVGLSAELETEVLDNVCERCVRYEYVSGRFKTHMKEDERAAEQRCSD